MKSLALSLLVAASLSLGAATAFAEGRVTVASPIASAQEATRQADLHMERARAHREQHRILSEKARYAFKVVENDLKQGFVYEAGVERARAEKFLADAQRNLVAAQREEALAAQCRALAAQHMGAYQRQLGSSGSQ